MNGKLISVKEAVDQILSGTHNLDAEQVTLDNALMRVLAQAIIAPYDFPLINNSSMDGFAVIASDTALASPDNPILLRVIADIPAGVNPDDEISPGQALRMMTGGVLPPSANAVVAVEDTDFNWREVKLPEYVNVYKAVQPGNHIRPKGQDVKIGDIILTPHRYLRAQEIGLLAMMGIDKVMVVNRPRIALLSTGDELTEIGNPLEPGKVYDANSFTLSSLIDSYGGIPICLGISTDSEDDVRSHLDSAVQMGVDMIISSAGVSVGAFDYVRMIIEKSGHLEFWRVNVRPGKPIAYGTYKDVPIIGLPGNPVSAFMGFEVFVRPAICKMLGLNEFERERRKVILSESVESDGRESYLRALVYSANGKMMARLTGHQGSGNLRSLVQANALLIVPSEVKFLPIGTKLDAWMIGEIISEEN